jgi:hypothetical protein
MLDGFCHLQIGLLPNIASSYLPDISLRLLPKLQPVLPPQSGRSSTRKSEVLSKVRYHQDVIFYCLCQVGNSDAEDKCT